jgi:hypothetical protein
MGGQQRRGLAQITVVRTSVAIVMIGGYVGSVVEVDSGWLQLCGRI